MKIFLKRLVLFFSLLMAILVLKKIFTPYFLGNVYFKPKLEYYNKNYETKDYNTVFFGSSRIFRHINPNVLDSIMSDENIETFNFGTVGTYNPESYFLYENFINNQADEKIDYAFLEIQALNDIDAKNLATTKGNYWNSIEFLNFAINYISDTNKSDSEKSDLMARYFKSHLYSYFDVKIFKHYSMDTKNTARRMGSDGFYSLDDDLEETPNNRVLNQRRENFLADTEVLKERRQSVLDIYERTSDMVLNEFHYTYLLSLIEKSKEKGIDLIFVLPPRLTEEQYLELLPISNQLPKRNVINLSDPKTYDKLYMNEYSYDVGHLNARGAILMTTYLANEFKDKLQLRDNGN
ncbi:MAG: hypothetical protein WBG46_12070 [Nonlabens sp.]